jgi:ABC-2 type transport system permease protein
VAPSVAIGLGQLAMFGAINVIAGVPLPADPIPLLLAVIGGIALCVGAGLATAIVTTTPERAQITTLPLTFVLLVAAIAVALVPTAGAWRALVAVPGAAVGDLTRLAFVGGTWTPEIGGIPAVVPAVVALAAWSLVFGLLARRYFRWEDRNA